MGGWVGHWVWIGVGRLCPPVRDDIVTRVTCFLLKEIEELASLVAYGWAGAANPHPHPTPLPTPLPTQTHTQKASKTLDFPLFDSCSQTDGQTDGPTNRRTKPVIELRVRN